MRVLFLLVSVQGRRNAEGLATQPDSRKPLWSKPRSQEAPMESGRWWRGTSSAAGSVLWQHTQPSPFPLLQTTLSRQAGFSTCLFLLSSFLPGRSDPRKFPAESIHCSPGGMWLAPRISSILGWKVQYKETLPGAPLAPEWAQAAQTPRFWKGRVSPTPTDAKARTRGRSSSPPLPTPAQTAARPPSPQGHHFFALRVIRALAATPRRGHLQPPARRCRSSISSIPILPILPAPSIAATLSAALAARGTACSTRRARGSAPVPSWGRGAGMQGGEGDLRYFPRPPPGALQWLRRGWMLQVALSIVGYIPAHPGPAGPPAFSLPRSGSTCPAAAPRHPPCTRSERPGEHRARRRRAQPRGGDEGGGWGRAAPAPTPAPLTWRSAGCDAPRRGMLRAARTKSRKWLQQVHFRGSPPAPPHGGGGSPGPRRGKGLEPCGRLLPRAERGMRSGAGGRIPLTAGLGAAGCGCSAGAGGAGGGAEPAGYPGERGKVTNPLRLQGGDRAGGGCRSPPETRRYVSTFGSLRRQGPGGISHLTAAESQLFSLSSPLRTCTIARFYLPF